MTSETPAAVLLCGHGTRDAEGVAEFERLRRAVAARLAPTPVERGYLELAAPDIAAGLEALHAQGARRIAALPVILFAAGHMRNDIPAVLDGFAARHPDAEIAFARELTLDDKLVAAAADRVAEAEKSSEATVARADSLLLVVGRGTSDAKVNANAVTLAELLRKRLGHGHAAVAYAGAAEPGIAEALDQAAKLGVKRVTLFPCFLFTGVLVKRVYAAADAAATRHPQIEFLKAAYLKDHPLMVETIVDRLREIGFA
ncbi:MAG TPA: CbiX/SirB N-terminal domain-containing protein [Alphaproteobacteria bacterium]|jgi:sirohydrochlorin cobaltochelatase